MSGGHFDYKYFQLQFLAEELEEELDSDEEMSWHEDCYDKDIKLFRNYAKELKIMSRIFKEIEWYFSGDTGIEEMKENIAQIKAGKTEID